MQTVIVERPFAPCLYAEVDNPQYKSISMLVDTGSTFSLFSFVDYLKLPNRPLLYDTNAVLSTADGRPLWPEGMLRLEFDVANKSFRHDFLVVDMKLYGMLGIDFILKQKYNINVTEMALVHGQERIPLTPQTKVPTCALVRLAKTVRIPPLSEKIVQGIASEDVGAVAMLLEPGEALVNRKLLLAKSLVNGNNINMCILNMNNKPVELPVDSVIGRVETVTELDNIHNGIKSPSETVPEHLQFLVKEASGNLNSEEVQKLEKLIIEFEDISMEMK
ncbi:hypothetical protein LOTGIDRAFT_165447 [Lottia gigantea]|uniref:Peptidase A2 domain-containing protein n=1 Tax=Lottia gigantea TaxID=225164 RepID=V3ZWA1_LOTGI|nr:hypothetical protein LOTGIDRAFT_165447 [Lottia gigantea]ESO88662.1 hypothetical protein LOTGIDRAFT_165447 [Lottia gigantea]